MRIAFYAPLKSPDHTVASGDRAMARALIAALKLAGHDVTLASRFRSRDGGDAARQARLRDVGTKLVQRYLRRIAKGAPKPDLWFTYHLYHKAPDWLGPRVTERLGIPYVIAEASFAPKQAGGKWDIGHRASEDAIRRADLVLEPNPADAECVRPLLASPERLAPLAPFVETAPLRARDRNTARSAVRKRLELEADAPWLLAVGMMREDQKLLSYRLLAEALMHIRGQAWQLIIAGAGPAEAKVREAFAPLSDHVRWIGIVPPEDLRKLYRAADIYVWPAIKEAWGMALLEAQAAGLPVVAGRSGGVPAIVADGETGLLAPEGDAGAFANAVAALLADPTRREAMGRAAMLRAQRDHDISVAAKYLDGHLRGLVPDR
jgi:glycosyltransferase involved in cell wall biosynthesis